MWLLKFEYKELEFKGHAGILPFIPGPQNVVNKATDFAYMENSFEL